MGYPAKGRADYFAPGDWNARCYECGAKYKASELIKHWQGYYVCSRCYEPRQPQDFVRGTQDVQTVPWSQPQVDITLPQCGIAGRSSYADLAVADCALPDYTPNVADADPTWIA